MGNSAGMIQAWASVLVENAEVRVAAVDDALGAWEAAAVGALGGMGSSGAGVIWAVNEVGFGASDPLPIEEPLYGADAQQLQDLARLGASLARHLYRRDLTWDQLGQGVAVPDREGPLRDLVFANAAALVTFLESAYAEGRRVIFTCIVHGGARDISLDTGGTPVFERSDGTGVMEAYALQWSSGHDLANVSGTRAYLDIRNSYELGFLEVMGDAIGQLLVDVAGLITTFSLDDVVAGIEVFDLIDDRNVDYVDSRYAEGEPTLSGEHWAEAFYRVASAVYARLDAAGISVPFRLPGLSSYYESADRTDGRGSGDPNRRSGEYRAQFLAAFLEALSGEAAAGTVPASALSSALHVTWERHSYKEKDTDYEQLGAGHIAALVGDLARYRSVLDDAGYDHTDLSVIRSGSSVNDPDTVIPYFASRLVPTWWDGLPGMPIRQHLDAGRAWFQAYDVWRRVFGAAAAHALEVGWESWMSDTRGGSIAEGYGMGLRDDRALATRSPSVAVPRPSWIAYQRLTDRVGTILSARLLNPYPPTDMGYKPTRGLDYLVIMVARVTGAGKDVQYAYLLLIDPTLPSTRSGSYTVAIDWRSVAAAARCWSVPTVPNEAPTIKPTPRGPTSTLRVADVEYDPDIELTLTHWLNMRAGDPPVLLLSTAPLTFSMTEAGAIDPGPEDPGDDLPRFGPLVFPPVVWYTPENADESLDRLLPL
jgi:hypothetical protein